MILIALGANLPGPFGPPERGIEEALSEMTKRGIKVIARSKVHKTAPVPISSQPWYSNAVAAVQTDFGAWDVFRILKQIERDFGRRDAERNAARILDLDLLAYNSDVMDAPDLVLPHPRMHERTFVLGPLREIAPNWRHPLLKKSVGEMIAGLPMQEAA